MAAAESLEQARSATDTEPSKAQQAAGNYKKGRLTWNGFTIAIENPKGSTRSGTNKAGKSWSTVMKHDYGYFEGIIGRDKDHLDVFVGPHLDCELIHVVNQHDPATGKFDEHKVVIGAMNAGEAGDVYLANYEQGWKGLGTTKAMTLDGFREWTKRGDLSKQAEIQAYKQFRTLSSRPGELFPLFINRTEPVPQGEWLDAENIPTEGFAPRPGWHAGALPAAPHLRSKSDRIQPGRVWAEVELPDEVDWQSIADASPTGDVRDRVPEDGHYRKKTPRMQGGEWLIGGKLRVNRVLDDDQVSELLRRAGELDAAEKERRVPSSDLLKHAAETVKSNSGTNWRAELERIGRESDKRAPAPEGTPSASFYRVAHIEHVPVCPHCGEAMGEKSDCWDPDYKDCWRHRACYDKGPFFIEYPPNESDGCWAGAQDADGNWQWQRKTETAAGPQCHEGPPGEEGSLGPPSQDSTEKTSGDTCTVCKEPWSTCLGRHGTKPCACGSGKPRNKCDCPGGTPDKTAMDDWYACGGNEELYAQLLAEKEVRCPLSTPVALEEAGLDPHPIEKAGICQVVLNLREGRPVLMHLDDGDKVAVAFDENYLYFAGEDADEHCLFDTVRSRWSSKEAVVLSTHGAEMVKQAAQIARRDTDLNFNNYGDLSKLKAQQIVDFVIQHHLAQRSGPHYDVRFGTPQTGLYSWATKHELPAIGEKRMLFQQPVHPHDYGNFVGYLKGYGQGEVRRHHKGKITMVQAGPNKVEFVTDEETPRRFVMIRPANMKQTHWLLLQRPYQKDPSHDGAVAGMSSTAAQVPGQSDGLVSGDRTDPGVDRALADPGFVQSLAAGGGGGDQPDLAQLDAGARSSVAAADSGIADHANQSGATAVPASADGADPVTGDAVDGSATARLRPLKSGADDDNTDVKRPPIVAVDVDGTLAQDYEEFDPDHIPPPRPNAKKWLDKFREAGAIVILHTVRGKDSVLRAWAKEHKLPYDFINESPYQPPGSSNKLFADVYVDDKAVSVENWNTAGDKVLDRLDKVADDAVVCDFEKAFEFLKICR